MKDCPPAQSIGKTVMDKGYMFVWDPRENVPYLIAPENINRCKLKVPRNAMLGFVPHVLSNMFHNTMNSLVRVTLFQQKG